MPCASRRSASYYYYTPGVCLRTAQANSSPVPKVELKGHRPSATTPAHLSMTLVPRGPQDPAEETRKGGPPPLLYCYRTFVPLVPQVLVHTSSKDEEVDQTKSGGQ